MLGAIIGWLFSEQFLTTVLAPYFSSQEFLTLFADVLDKNLVAPVYDSVVAPVISSAL